MRVRPSVGWVSCALSCAAFAACGSSAGSPDKLGASTDTTVLRLASASGTLSLYPAVAAFADAVERRSHGRLRIKLVDRYGAFADDAEQQIVRGVAAHDVDLGYVRTGVFDTFGVTSLQALSAPMLMRSYAVEQETLDSDMGTTMLAAVGKAGVSGIALLGDQMRRPFATRGPLRGPADYRGLRVASYPSHATDEALRELGASTSHEFGGPLMDALAQNSVDGFERTLRVYTGDTMAGLAPFATANVALWPQVLALIANPDTLRRLTQEQRDWLRDAGADAARESIPAARAQEQDAVAAACEAGTRFGRASQLQLAALRARFASTYTELERDAQTRAFIARIRELDAGVPPDAELHPPASCTGRPASTRAGSATAARRFDGTWRWRVTERDRRHDPNGTGETVPGDDIFTMRIAGGHWTLHLDGSDGTVEDDTGTVAVDGDEIVFDWEDFNAIDRYRFRLNGDVLLLKGVSGDRGDLFVWGTNPWRRIG